MSEELKVKDLHCQNCAHKWREAVKDKLPYCPKCGSEHTQILEKKIAPYPFWPA